jgi:hypothetical protein
MFEQESDDLRLIKGLPFLKAFLGGILGPVIIAIVFGLLGARNSALLMQVELILIAIAFCLPGILARSKLVGLSSFITSIIAWFLLYGLDLVTGGLIPNPFGIFTGLNGPVSSIINSGLEQFAGIAEFSEVIRNILILLDVVIVVLFFGVFLSFFLSMIATGFWTKKGTFSIISIISKPIAAIFAITILISIPFVYHGVGNLVYGGVAMAAGATEFMEAFGVTGGGSGSQGFELDLNDPDVIANLSASAARAAEWFRKSSTAFQQLQGNFLVNMIIDTLFPEGSEPWQGINMQEATKILDIAEVLALISADLPSLFAGFQNLVSGFDTTFTILGTTDLGGGFGGSINSPQAEYNQDFVVGLNQIAMAIENFTDAEEGVGDALLTAKDIVADVFVDQNGSGLEIIGQLIDEFAIGYGIILDMAAGGISFLNATYKTTLAVEELGDSDFPGANEWLNDAAGDLSSANTTMQAIDTSDLNPSSPLPFWGSVEIIRDMTNLLTWFALAAANGTQCYTAIEGVLTTLQGLDFNGTDVLDTQWDDFATNVSNAATIFSAAEANINSASTLSTSYTAKTYGPLIDGSIKPMLIEFSQMLDSFSSNVTEMGFLLDGLSYTVNSIQSFTEGFKLFNSTFTQAMNDKDNETHFFQLLVADPNLNISEDLMGYAIFNASAGWTEIDGATLIDISVKTSWQNILFYPAPPYDPPNSPNATEAISIAGLAYEIRTKIAALKAASTLLEAEENQTLIEELFAYMETLDLSSIFGGGG